MRRRGIAETLPPDPGLAPGNAGHVPAELAAPALSNTKSAVLPDPAGRAARAADGVSTGITGQHRTQAGAATGQNVQVGAGAATGDRRQTSQTCIDLT